MKLFMIDTIPGFDEWREQARFCLAQNIAPYDVCWNTGMNTQVNLFGEEETQKISTHFVPTVPKDFIELARTACCHNDADRFNLLYRLLWRITYQNRNLLRIVTDANVLRLSAMVKSVRRDAYKITAFLRFREIMHEGREHFIAWYEPEHYTLERVLDFFQTRFRNMHWSILTPYRAAHWDGTSITLQDNPDPDLYPKDDKVEQYWLTYYANIFNPARTKKSAMLSQMPKKYWNNMPETVLIPELLRTADKRAKEMIEKSKAPR